LKQLVRFCTAVILSVSTFAFTGCKEDTIINDNLGQIGVEVIPDTITVLSKTVVDDSIATSLTTIGTATLRIIHGAGVVDDPFFGHTTSGIYLQVLPEKTNYSFSANQAIIDSAFVVLPYAYFQWGDTANPLPQTFSVYRVTEDLKKDDVYYSKTTKTVDYANPVSNAVVIDPKKIKDSVKVLGKNQGPHLRIRLKDVFKDELVNVAANSADIASFLNSIKGLYVAPDSTKPGNLLTYFVLNEDGEYGRASVQFFYHDKNSTNEKISYFNFTSADCAHYNYITRNYSGYPINNYLNSTANSDSVVFLQNEPGAAIDLKFPYLKNLPIGPINKAEITITMVSLSSDLGATDKLFPPAAIFPIGIDAFGTAYTLLDRQPVTETAPASFVDGRLKTVTLPNGITVSRYTLNIPREVQKAIVNKTDALHLRINGTQSYPGAYRLIAGGKHSVYKISLNISYSKLQ
jgi:hypothetical protein